MGITGSKVAQEDKEDVTAGSVPTTPILTPKVKKTVEELVDPRSPSCSILRTPITSASPLTPEANTCDTFNINSPVLIKNLEDPRSPTCAFTRTPITAVDDTIDLLKRVQIRNLQNIKKVISDMPSQIPPKLLESSPIHRKPDENRRKSFVGLLETNLDYVETDLDAVIMSKSSPSQNQIKSVSPSKAELKAKFLESVEPEIEPITSTPVQNDKSDDDNVLDTIKTDIVDDDGLITQKDTISTVQEAAAPEIINATPKKIQIEVESEPITATVQEFEKKVNHLIYTEEEHIISTPPVNKHAALQAKTASNRTPLGTRNGNNATNDAKVFAKNKPKLRVSDKPRRADYAVSKIPVFSSKNKAECENTPPRNMLDARKTRRAQWDSDNTLII
ncbi:uncharacterized protein [Atheta coriaria]|uniref:uncharacterized protein n=1 Tax=Dalotia coriaria TaxID=877792 RepID=UPI0031F3F183